MARSLNKVMLIGNLTRDPELRYTPQGTAVVTFSVATNRQWKTESGETKDQADFHRIVAWDKLAEICGKMLKKGMKVYVEGRLQTRSWQAQDASQKQTTEIIISDMLMLDSKKSDGSVSIPDDFDQEPKPVENTKPSKKSAKTEEPQSEPKEEEVNEDDIPF